MTGSSADTTLPGESLRGPVPGVPALMRKYDLRAKKGLGQHFLHDTNILCKIVAAAELGPGSVVLEIGPGLGSLTVFLAQTAARVVAVELDVDMVDILRAEMGHLSNLRIVHGDILKLRPEDLVSETPAKGGIEYTVVANLPYYITSAIIRHLLEASSPPSRLVLMVQHEVAQRIVAAPGDMSLLSVSVQFFGAANVVARIPAGAFVPPPQVDSAVVRIDTYRSNPYLVSDRRQFFRVVKAGFGQKRKQLHNALASGLALRGEEVGGALVRAGIDPRRRAQTLSLDEWVTLAAQFHSPAANHQ